MQMRSRALHSKWHYRHPGVLDDVGIALLKIAPEAASDVAITVDRRYSLATVADRIASSTSSNIDEFAVLSSVRPIIYFAKS